MNIKLSAYSRYQINNIVFKYLRPLIGYVLLVIALILLKFNNNSRGVGILLTSLRLKLTKRGTDELKKIHATNILEDMVKGSDDKIENTFGRSIILSMPSNENDKFKKGVLLITFTQIFSRFLKSKYFDLYNKNFVFILEPSGSGYADQDVLAFIKKADHCLVQSTEQEDKVFLNILYPEGITTSFGASDWVNPEIFTPQSKSPKEYDSIYVANTHPVKRVYRYIDAISNIIATDSSYIGCLVCAKWGGEEISIKKYIKSKNIEDNLVFIPGLPREELVKELNKSKVNILLSLKEGSNRSLFESMFIDMPVICLSENIGVNKSYINEHTGLLIPDYALEESLLAMKKSWSTYAARKWALQNISPQVTTHKLAELLDQKFPDVCNCTLSVKTNAPEVGYYNQPSNVHVDIQKLVYKEPLKYGKVSSKITLPSYPKNAEIN